MENSNTIYFVLNVCALIDEKKLKHFNKYSIYLNSTFWNAPHYFIFKIFNNMHVLYSKDIKTAEVLQNCDLHDF